MYITFNVTFAKIFVMTSQVFAKRAAKNRTSYKLKKGFPRKPYSKLLPKHRNKILEWIAKNRPEWAVLGNTLNPDLLSSLSRVNMSVKIFKKILLNETIMTIDELYDIASILECSAKDLL